MDWTGRTYFATWSIGYYQAIQVKELGRDLGWAVRDALEIAKGRNVRDIHLFQRGDILGNFAQVADLAGLRRLEPQING